MRRHLIHFLLVAVLTVCSAATAIAQVTVKGQVVDAETGEPLIGAAVTIVGTTQGSVTNLMVCSHKKLPPVQRCLLSTLVTRNSARRSPREVVLKIWA